MSEEQTSVAKTMHSASEHAVLSVLGVSTVGR